MAGGTLTAVHACRIGRFIGNYFGKGARVVIGKDTRRSSYMLEYALAAGLTSSGADAYIMHVTTTASVSFITRTDGFDCGIMISASHNPYTDNGIKLFASDGGKMDENFISLLESYLDCPRDMTFLTGADIGRTVDYVSARNRYIGHLIALSACSFKGYRVGLDCANGSAWQMAKSVFDALGAKTHVIGCSPDGTNINEGGATNCQNLCTLTKDLGLDVGFAFDGDADRCIACDGAGNVCDGDGIMYICANYMKDRGELSGGNVVATVMSNGALAPALAAKGINCVFTGVGDRVVYKKMCGIGASLGGEQSGHIIFTKYGQTGDGLVTAIKLMEIIAESGCSLPRLLAGYSPCPQVLKNVRVADKTACLTKEFKERIEGMRGSGVERVVVRPSGTEPVVRIMAEGQDRAACEKCCDNIARYLGDM